MGFKSGGENLTELDVGSGTLKVDSAGDKVGVGTDSPKTKLTVEGTVTIKEQANAESDTAAYGQLWVKSNTPCDLFFTDDSGQDVRLTNDGSIAASGARSVAGDTDNGIITWVTSDNTFAAEANFTYDGTDLAVTCDTATFTSANADDPVLALKNTNDDATGSTLKFIKDGTSAADNDVIGNITFVSENDAVSPETITYAVIQATCPDVSDGAEEGKLTLSVASHDAELQPGLIIESGDAEDEVNVTIGNGGGDVLVAGTFGAMRNMASGLGDIDAAGKASNGDIIYGIGSNIGSLTAGKIYYFEANGTWVLADANAATSATGLIGVATHSAHGAGGGVLMRGFIQLDTLDGTQAAGEPVYISETAGAGDATAPSASGDIVRIIGYATDASNTKIWLDPDKVWVEVA